MTHEEARKIEDMIEKRVYHILDNDDARSNYYNVLDAQILFGNRSFEALQVAYQEVCAEMGHIGHDIEESDFYDVDEYDCYYVAEDFALSTLG